MMSEPVLGELVLEVASRAAQNLVLCAPFAKVAVVERVLGVLHEGVSIDVFTRWRPDEVAAGVSDVGVLMLVEARGGRVWLHDRLHAKFFRNETTALSGSANLTGAALGWRPDPNLELLSEVPMNAVEHFENRLRNESIAATTAIAQEIQSLAAELAPQNPLAPVSLELEAIGQDAAPHWIPTLRDPADLYFAYRHGSERLSSASGEAAAVDLKFLELPMGLSATTFDQLVRHRLLGSPLVRELDEYLAQPRRFGDVRSFLAQRLGVERDDASVHWQTLMRWLLKFVPDRYDLSAPRWSEVVRRIEETS